MSDEIQRADWFDQLEVDRMRLVQERDQLRAEVTRLTARVAELAAALPRWIPVEERLPEDFMFNLILVFGRFCYVAFYVSTEKVWFIDTPNPADRIPVSQVTDWQPLPERPAALASATPDTAKEGQE